MTQAMGDLYNAQNPANISVTLQNLFQMLVRVDKYYATQIQSLDKKVKDLAQSQGISLPATPETVSPVNSDASHLQVAPGSNVTIDAPDASSAEINL